MGSHICSECGVESVGRNKYVMSSSGDVGLLFTNGHRWVMPDMILHYVGDHGWQPPETFVDDVMNGQFASGDRRQTRGVVDVLKELRGCTPVGYLEGRIVRGSVPTDFVKKLEALMQQAGAMGLRVQTKGIAMRG